jgi:hypothetical protein
LNRFSKAADDNIFGWACNGSPCLRSLTLLEAKG